MEYEILGFSGYRVNDDNQIIKTTQTSKGEKVSLVAAHRTNEASENLYVKLSRREGEQTVRYTLPLEEVCLSAKLGIEPGTPESKMKLKQFRHEQGLMGRVSFAGEDPTKQQEVVNLLHADLIRQMNTVGLHVDVDHLTTYTVAQMLFDYLRICKETSQAGFTQTVTTKNGESLQEHPLWTLKAKIYDRVVTGLRALGLTLERTVKNLPPDAMAGLSANMFEQQEREEAAKNLGITWNQ